MSTASVVTVPLNVLNRDSSTQSGGATRFHLSLNVSNIERLASFLELVLCVAPAKQRADYAKFELDSPPLVLSLEQNPPQEAGSLNHLGFRFSSLAELEKAQQRIEAAGIPVQREEGVECCYAKQTKFWVHDPDHRLWEFYVLDGDLQHRGGGQTLEQMVGDSAACQIATTMRRPVVWEHRMGSEFSLPSEKSDQIRLRGTFNVPVTDGDITQTLRGCFQNLKAGGQIELHMLTADRPLTCAIELPGPAAYVKHVPVRASLLMHLTDAGFVDCRLTTFRSKSCFQLAGEPLRETKIVATKPRSETTEQVVLVYRGPFAKVHDDAGHVWQRGVAATCTAERWEALKAAGFESSFTVIPAFADVSSCGV